jgi:hypothetical protein
MDGVAHTCTSDWHACLPAIIAWSHGHHHTVLLLKAALMGVVLYAMLLGLAQLNQIKKTLRWPDEIPNWPENKPGEKGVRIKLEAAGPGDTGQARFIRLPRASMNPGGQEIYNNRVADVTFKYEGQTNGEERTYTGTLKVYVGNKPGEDGSDDSGYGTVTVDQNTHNALRNVLSAANADGSTPQLRTSPFSVKMKSKKFRAVHFLLLRHPDPTCRITGWVTVLTSIYTVVYGVVFG